MKNIVILFIVLLCTLCIKAQTLSGRVTDSITKESIPGVVIYLPELKVGAQTDTGGYYRLTNLPKRNVLVQVTVVGYSAITENVNLSNTTHKDFKLSQSATLGNEVVVTGVSQATELKKSPISIVAIDHMYIQQNLYSNAIDAIVKIPGINALTTGPNVSKPFIRGLGYNRVLTLYDGQRQEGQQWGDEHGIEIDQYNIDRMEVIKGPASLMYGSDAVAGVVSIIPTPAAPEGKIIGNVLNEYQSNNGEIGNSVMLQGNKNGFEWMGRVSHKMAKDYQNAIDGYNYATAFEETDASATVGLNKSWGYSHLSFGLFDDLQEIPDGSRDPATGKFTEQVTEADTTPRPVVPESELNTYKISALHQYVQLYRLYTNNQFLLTNGGKIDVSLGWEGSTRREFSHPTSPDIAGLYLILNSYTYDFKYYFPDSKGWKPVIGINGMYQTNNADNGTEAVIPSYKLLDVGGFGVITKTYKKLELAAGARYDIRSFNNSAMYFGANPSTGYGMVLNGSDTAGAYNPFKNFKTTFSGVTGSLGGSYSVSDKFIIKANIARGYRAPNIAEISANGVHPGTNFYQIGNPDIKPEFSLQEDLGFSYTSKIVEVSLDFFNDNISNYIYDEQLLSKVKGDSVIVPGNTTFKFVSSQADLYGGELSVDIHITKWLHFENGLSTVTALNLGDGKQPVTDSTKYLPFIPPFHVTSDLRATFGKSVGAFSHIFAKIEAVYYAAQNEIFSAYGTETPTPGYTLFNAGLGTDITTKRGKTICTFSLMGNNLTDLNYQDHLSRLKYFGYNYVTGKTGMFNMGRNFGIKLVIPLDLT
ncbi:MAG TPA: TonB-dependent receptor [Bacteroidia bacterium]|nr:TonB-dependent receptor [Bacteroidia bacterium]